MSRITIVNGTVADNVVVVDGRAIYFPLAAFLSDLSIHAVQWFDSFGEIEEGNGDITPIVSIVPFQAALNEFAILAAAEDLAAIPVPPTPLQQAVANLRDAGVTPSSLAAAMYLDSKGIPARLVALDAIVAAEVIASGFTLTDLLISLGG